MKVTLKMLKEMISEELGTMSETSDGPNLTWADGPNLYQDLASILHEAKKTGVSLGGFVTAVGTVLTDQQGGYSSASVSDEFKEWIERKELEQLNTYRSLGR